MTRQSKIKIIAILFTLLLTSNFLVAEIIQDKDFNFSLDLPEGYKIDDYTEDGMSYIFSHPNIPVTLALKIYYDDSFTSSQSVLKMTLEKLTAKGDIDSVKWSEKNCAISSFTMNLDKSYSGWSVCAPTKIEHSYVALICYAPTDLFPKCQQFIMSSLNSLCINDDYYYAPGLITTYAYPKEGKKNITAKIAGKQITSSMDKSDTEASKFLIDLEFAVFSLYAKMPNWKEAWQRYYRMIYRDNCGRTAQFSSDVFKALYPACQAQNPENPDITYAQTLLSWVQNFNYKRSTEKTSSDFTSIPSVLNGEGNDCDSRSMLITIMLNNIGIDTIFLISREYSHALVATDIKAPGQTYILEETGKEYLFGETTSKVTWGMIAGDQADRTKWIPITLP